MDSSRAINCTNISFFGIGEELIVRKIVLIVVGVVLLAACAAGGVAMAQDIAENTDPIKFTGKGTIEGTVNMTGVPFSVTGSVTKTSIKGLAPGDVTGDATVDSCTINEKARKECCTFTSTEKYSFSEGDVDVMFAGIACGKKPTKATGKIPFNITGGTGFFAGASGSGKASFTVNEVTGKGKFSFSGQLTE